MNMNIVKTMQINMRSGRVMTLELSDTLLNRVKDTFMLSSDDEVTEDQVKYYIASSMKNLVRTQTNP